MLRAGQVILILANTVGLHDAVVQFRILTIRGRMTISGYLSRLIWNFSDGTLRKLGHAAGFLFGKNDLPDVWTQRYVDAIAIDACRECPFSQVGWGNALTDCEVILCADLHFWCWLLLLESA